MEERVRQLENKLNELTTIVSTSKWWAAVIGAIILGFMGATSFFTIPNQISNALKERGVEQLINELKKYVSAAKEDSDTIARLKSSSSFVKLYQCPVKSDLKRTPVAWASYGCNGQISSEPQCTNISWPYIAGLKEADSVPFACSEITLYRK